MVSCGVWIGLLKPSDLDGLCCLVAGHVKTTCRCLFNHRCFGYFRGQFLFIVTLLLEPSTRFHTLKDAFSIMLLGHCPPRPPTSRRSPGRVVHEQYRSVPRRQMRSIPRALPRLPVRRLLQPTRRMVRTLQPGFSTWPLTVPRLK
jgi:hypothetical protein